MYFLLPTNATCPTHLILFAVIILIIQVKCKNCKVPHYVIFIHLYVTLCVFFPDILYKTIFSDTATTATSCHRCPTCLLPMAASSVCRGYPNKIPSDRCVQLHHEWTSINMWAGIIQDHFVGPCILPAKLLVPSTCVFSVDISLDCWRTFCCPHNNGCGPCTMLLQHILVWVYGSGKEGIPPDVGSVMFQRLLCRGHHGHRTLIR
jgi:hypothetical protein